MIKHLLALAALTLLIGSGCASKAVRREMVEVRTNPKEFKAEPAPHRSRAYKINPTAFEYYLNASLYESIGNLYRAAESYRQALKFYPGSYEIRYSLAEVSYRMQHFDDALTALGVIDPQDARVWELRAAIYRGNGNEDAAKNAYLKSLAEDSSNSDTYAYLAGWYGRDGQLDSTAWALRHMARLNPENYAVWFELARVELRSDSLIAAQQAFRKSADIYSGIENSMALVGLGEVYEARGKLDSALISFKEALVVDSENIAVHRNLAGIYVRLDSLEQAARHARIESNLAPLDRNSARRLGMLYFFLDSLQQADSIFTWLIDSGERNPLNEQYLGRIKMRQGDADAALPHFRQVIQMTDTTDDVWIDLALAYRTVNDTTHELSSYQHGLERVKERISKVRLLFSLGAALERYGQFDSSVATFKRLLDLDPNHDGAMNYLGYMLADHNQDLKYARELIEKALEISPDNPAYLDSYGWVLYRMGKYKDARKYLERAVELDTDPIMFDHLGDTYQALGKMEEARHWWRKALDEDPENAAIEAKLAD